MLIIIHRNALTVLNCLITFAVLNEPIFSATSLVKKNSYDTKLEVFEHLCYYFLSCHIVSDEGNVRFVTYCACYGSL